MSIIASAVTGLLSLALSPTLLLNLPLLIRTRGVGPGPTLPQHDLILTQLHQHRPCVKPGGIHRFWVGLNFVGTLVHPVESSHS